jgi:hypothetical protein
MQFPHKCGQAGCFVALSFYLMSQREARSIHRLWEAHKSSMLPSQVSPVEPLLPLACHPVPQEHMSTVTLTLLGVT